MIKISIVIPVYNVAKYLPECLESICKQNFQNLQVICIDDCSTDDSYNVLLRYQAQYKFIEVYHNESNKGLSCTRNIGVEYAKGQYIMYVDADDYIAPDILYELYAAIEKEGADVMLFDVQEVENGECRWSRRIRKNVYACSKGIQLLSDLVRHNEMFAGVWSGIYKKEFLEQNRIVFIEGILHEDIPYMFAVLMKASSAAYFSRIVYYYRQRENSILHKPDYEKLALGLLIGHSDMLSTWHWYGTRNADVNQYNICVMEYVKSVGRLFQSRCDCLLRQKQKPEDGVLSYFLDNFEIAVKRCLTDYFSLEDIEQIRQRGCVSIYGAGDIARNIVPLLKQAEIRIDKIYVTDTNKNPASLFGISVMQFEDIPFQKKEHCIVVAASNKNKTEMVELLKKKDYRGHIYAI